MARITRWAVLLVTVLCMQGLVPAQERPAARPQAKPASALPAVPPGTGVTGEKPFAQRLPTVGVGGRHAGPLTPADVYVYEYAWSPDSKTIAAIAAHGSGDNNWYIAQLYTLAVASGEMKSI